MLTKRIISGVALAASSIVFSLTAHAADLTGAGATFPYPIYSKWAEAYKAATGIGLNYQSIGSGGGIKQIKAKTVDFGASDMPLKADELEKEGLMQFPAIIGGVVPVMNLDGIAPGQLKLTADVISAIHLGKITKWNAPEIAAFCDVCECKSGRFSLQGLATWPRLHHFLIFYLLKISHLYKFFVLHHSKQ